MSVDKLKSAREEMVREEFPWRPGPAPAETAQTTTAHPRLRGRGVRFHEEPALEDRAQPDHAADRDPDEDLPRARRGGLGPAQRGKQPAHRAHPGPRPGRRDLHPDG